MKSLLYLLLALTLAPAATARRPKTCTMGGYTYEGVYYSTAHAVKNAQGVEACHERTAMDAAAIKKQYDELLAKINALVEDILGDPLCVDVHDVLNEYKQRLSRHEAAFADEVSFNMDFLPLHLKSVDVQRQFAYISLYNSTCSGMHDRKTSFIDLDTINQVPVSQAPKTSISKDGEMAEDCADVSASGSEDLNEFKISVKKAKGEDVLFSFDPFGIPDRMVLKDESGSVLFDSGCTSTKAEHQKVSMPLSKISGKMVVASVENNCSSPSREKGVSAWVFEFKCQQDAPGPCDAKKAELKKLLKEKVELYKTLLDGHWIQGKCYQFLDETVLADLIRDGLVLPEGDVLVNGICKFDDEECENKMKENRERERNPGHAVPDLSRQAASEPEKRKCPPKPWIGASVLEHISRAYCTIGTKRLGVE